MGKRPRRQDPGDALRARVQNEIALAEAERAAVVLRAAHQAEQGYPPPLELLLEICGPVFAVSALSFTEWSDGMIQDRGLRISTVNDTASLLYTRDGSLELVTAYPIPAFLRGAIHDPTWHHRDDVLRALGIDPVAPKTRLDALVEACGTPVIANLLPAPEVTRAVTECRGVSIDVHEAYDDKRHTRIAFRDPTHWVLRADLVFDRVIPPYLRTGIERAEWDGFDAALRSLGVTPPKPTMGMLIAVSGRPDCAEWWHDTGGIQAAIRERRAMKYWATTDANLDTVDAGLSIVLEHQPDALQAVDYIFAAPIPPALHEIYVPITHDAGDARKMFGIRADDPRFPPSRDH